MASESPRTTQLGHGGFLPSRSALPSPTPSTASSRVAARLPHPRSRPLVPGSKKEDYARDYVARRLLHISRRYVKKFGIPDPADEVTGYETMDDVCRDLEEVVDVLWFSGTPSLQVPYLLNVALAFNTYLSSFPPAPRPTFALLRKIDHCFASLLVGYDAKTKEPLPGFVSTVDNNSAKSRFSRTDMVRCKSLADETRMLVAMVMSGEVDVVDHAEDEPIVRRPARAETVARNAPVEAPNSMPHGFHGMETVKTEEMEDEDNDFDFVSVNEEPTAPFKRQAEEITGGASTTDVPAEAKRIKVEDDGESSLDLSGIVLVDTSSHSMTTRDSKDDKGQFHWALEEDDDSDNEGHPNSSTETDNAATVENDLLPPPHHPNPNTVGINGDSDDVNEAEDNSGEYEEDEDEDEELQMNVGQVYEKTLVQLGQSLGESITDD